MRDTALLLLLAIAACASVMLASEVASSSPGDWTVTSSVVLEDESLLMEGNLTVVEGGLLEVRGTAITFNCTYPGQYVLSVQRGGGLVVTTSATGRGASIRSADPSDPTVVRVGRARTLRLENLLVEACGYYNPEGINEFYPAVSISDVDGPVVSRCTFRDCFRSLRLTSCADAVLEDNTVEDSEGFAVEVYDLTASKVEGNSISGTSRGIDCYFSNRLWLSENVVAASSRCIEVWGCDEVTVEGGRLSPEGGTALYVDSSKLVRVSGVRINGSLDPSGHSRGMVLNYASTATVRGCSLEDLGSGVRVVNSREFGQPYHFITDSRFSSCRSGIVLASSNNTLVGNLFSGCEVGVMVTDEINPMQPEIRAGASGNVLFSCAFEDCVTAIELVNATSTIVEGCDFAGGRDDLVAASSTGTREVDNEHAGWEGTAVRVVGGDYGALNVSLLDGPAGVRLEEGASAMVEQSMMVGLAVSATLDDGSLLDLVNTTHPRLYDVDGTSRIRVWWDVEVRTGYESGATRAIPGTLEIEDSGGKLVGTHHCVPSGPPVPVTVLEVELEGVSEHNWTPHEFILATAERTCHALVGIVRFTRVLMSLDDVAPTIVVYTPTDPATNRSSVWFSGRVDDGINGPAAYVVRIDAVEVISGSGDWSREVVMEQGPHVVTYEATDGSGNSANLRIELIVDTIPPELVVIEPGSNETLTSASSIRIVGRVTGHRLLLLGGEEVLVNGSRFEVRVPLDTDGEYTLELVALDWLDNAACATLRVVRDTVAPLLELDPHEPLTGEDTVVLGGSTDRTGATVRVDGGGVPLLPGGRFSVILDLEEGPNSFLFRAVDGAGNEALQWANITLDTVATLAVVSPLDNTTFDVQDIELVVLAEPGAEVRVRDQGWREADAEGYCFLAVTIFEGPNTIRVEARDAVGNEAMATIEVHYRPPAVDPEGGDQWPLLVAMLVVLAVVVVLTLHSRSRWSGN